MIGKHGFHHCKCLLPLFLWEFVYAICKNTCFSCLWNVPICSNGEDFFSKDQVVGVPYYLLLDSNGKVITSPARVEGVKKLVTEKRLANSRALWHSSADLMSLQGV